MDGSVDNASLTGMQQTKCVSLKIAPAKYNGVQLDSFLD